MTQVLKMSRKALTVGIVLTTLAWSMMATVLVAPLKASAAGCTSGSLIKGSLAAVYYCGADGKRYVFTNDKNYFTWYPDFSGVHIISDADLATLQIGGNVTYRPGVKMIKIQSDPKVYAISHGGVLRPIASEAVAAALYGSTWNHQIDDVSDAFFTNYTVGAAINSASDYDRNAEMSSSQTINQDKGLTGSTVVGGGIQTSLAVDNPSSKTIPAGATSVNFLKFNLMNTDSVSASISNLTLHRVGPGSTADIAAVYLYEGSTRLTTGRTVNSSTNDVTFSGLNWVIAAGQTRTFWVAVDISTGAFAGDVHAFQVTNIQAGAEVVGGLPLVGNNMTLAGTQVGSLTVSKSGTITNPKVGQTNVQIGQFQLAAGSVEDVWVNRVTLFQGGNLAGSNLTNLKLVQAGNTVATTASLDSKLHLVFNLAQPMLLQKGASKTFEVWGDIGGGARAGDTIALYVEESSDVYGVGATYGFGVRVIFSGFAGDYDGDACTSTAGDCSFSMVEGGQVTLSFNGPGSMNLPSNGKDKEIFNFTIASQPNVEIKRLTIKIDCGTSAPALGGCTDGTIAGSNPNYTDIKVTNKATGQVWWGPLDLSGDGAGGDSSQTLIFNDVQDLAAGSSTTFSVTTDIKSTVPSGDTLTATLMAFGSNDIRNLDNSTFISTSDIVPSGNLVGNPMTIVAPGLTLSLASTPVSQSFVKGSTAVPFLGVNLAAADGSDIKVTSMTFTGYVDADNGGASYQQGSDTGAVAVAVTDDVLSCKLFDGSTQLGDAKSPTTSAAPGSGGLLQFTNLNLTVAAAATKSLTLKCDTSNSAVAGSKVSFAIKTNASDVSAQDSDGNSVTANAGSVNAGHTVAITILPSGTITVQLAPSDSESEASLVVAGAQSAVLGKWRFTASNEELKLVKLTTYLDNYAAARSLTSVSLYDGSTLLAGPVNLTTTQLTNGSASSTAVFSGMSMIIPKDGSKTVTLKGSLNTISSGAMTGDNLAMRVYIPGADSATNTNAFEARGTSSSTVIRNLTNVPTTTNTAGADKLVRKTKPTVSLGSLPTTSLNDGTVVAMRFTVTADAAEQVSLKKLSFKVAKAAGTTLTPGSAHVREVGQGSDIDDSAPGATNIDVAGGGNCGFTSSATQACVRVVFKSEQVIAAGTSKTYELRIAATGTVAGNSISSTLLGDGADAVGELDAAAPATGIDNVVTGTTGEYNFLWSDNNQIPHNDVIDDGNTATDDAAASNDWISGNLVKVLPTDAQTLTK